MSEAKPLSRSTGDKATTVQSQVTQPHTENANVNKQTDPSLKSEQKNVEQTQNVVSFPSPLFPSSPAPLSSPTPSKPCQRIDSTNERDQRTLQSINLDDLNSEEKETAETIINELVNLFHLPGDRLTYSDTVTHKIETIDSIPINVRQYRFPPVHKEEIDRQIGELLDSEVIKPSTSPYNSPLWIVPKKPDAQGNKRWRLVIDYRMLNEKTVKKKNPLPNITEILDQLGSAKYFSTFDLVSSFHQIAMDEEDASKTAFSKPFEHYEFKRMPFGLKNAPSTF